MRSNFQSTSRALFETIMSPGPPTNFNIERGIPDVDVRPSTDVDGHVAGGIPGTTGAACDTEVSWTLRFSPVCFRGSGRQFQRRRQADRREHTRARDEKHSTSLSRKRTRSHHQNRRCPRRTNSGKGADNVLEVRPRSAQHGRSCLPSCPSSGREPHLRLASNSGDAQRVLRGMVSARPGGYMRSGGGNSFSPRWRLWSSCDQQTQLEHALNCRCRWCAPQKIPSGEEKDGTGIASPTRSPVRRRIGTRAQGPRTRRSSWAAEQTAG